MLSIRPYRPADAAAWDALVTTSRSGNLLHLRGFMDYHAERFVDASLLVERDGMPVAAFPANLGAECATSHAGLSYGGLLSGLGLRAAATLEAIEMIGAHYRQQGVRRIVYKAVPHVFHAGPAEEDLYALHRLGARLVRRDLSSVLPLGKAPTYTAERRRSIARARRAGIALRSGGDLAPFHALLSTVLQRHGVAPVHSLAELCLLQARFPGRIVLHAAWRGEELLAATLVFDFGRVVHTQYLAVSEEGRRLDALSLLLAELIERVYATRDWLSLGISTEQQGQALNAGLVEQKERFGARAVVHDVYEWPL